MMGDFISLAQLKLPVRIVVLNNGALGFVDGLTAAFINECRQSQALRAHYGLRPLFHVELGEDMTRRKHPSVPATCSLNCTVARCVSTRSAN